MFIWWFGILFGLSALVAEAEAGISEGAYRGSSSWVFIDRFAFAKGDQGQASLELLFPKNTGLELALYYLDSNSSKHNEFERWQDIYDGDLTCQERLARADGRYYIESSGFEVSFEPVDGKTVTRAKVQISVNSVRNRWVFVAVGNCPRYCNSCAGSLDLSWSMNFTSGSGFESYFSADHRGLFAMNIVFLILSVLLFIYQVRVARRLHFIRKYHSTVHLLLLSTLWTVFAIVVRVINYCMYASSGVYEPYFDAVTLVLEATAEWLTLLLIILLAKGWTITTRKLSATGRMKISIYLTTYICLYCMCFIYFRYAMPKEAVVGIYDTSLGYCLAVMRIFCWVWLMYAVKVTLRKYSKKRGFYKKFRMLMSLWMLSLPFFVLISQFTVQYYREKLLLGIMLTCNFILQSVLTMLYDPEGMFSKHFPFHSTVTIMFLRGRGQAGDQIARASEINYRINGSLSLFHRFTLDLLGFLEQVDFVTKDGELYGEDLPMQDTKVQNWVKSPRETFEH